MGEKEIIMIKMKPTLVIWLGNDTEVHWMEKQTASGRKYRWSKTSPSFFVLPEDLDLFRGEPEFKIKGEG